MKTLKIAGAIVAATALMGFAASQALAGSCQTIRSFPPAPGPSQDLMTMSCSHLGGPATAGSMTASTINGVKTVSAGKTAGGAGLTVVSNCLNSAGSVIGTAADGNIGGANPSFTCPFATTVQWRALVNFVE
jgi:hypothetical protein